MNKIIAYIAIFLIFISILPSISSKEAKTCIVYFTGVGCPHCAKTDPLVIIDLLKDEDVVVVEYEIYQQQNNAPLLFEYDEMYGSGLGIPLMLISKEKHSAGDSVILKDIENIKRLNNNPCPLANGSYVDFNDLDLVNLPKNPKIWAGNKVLIKTSDKGNNEILKSLITSSDIESVLENVDYNVIEPRPVALSGKEIHFDNAIELDGWLFQWNGKGVKGTKNKINEMQTYEEKYEDRSFTFTKIVSLAAVDAINPCALAVLTLMLIAILTYNPKKKTKILLAGIAFTTSVFLCT